MKKILPQLAMAFILLVPARFADAGLLRNALQSCAVGAAVMATVTYIGLTSSRIDAGILAIPASDVIVANAAFGCGVGAVGAVAGTVAGWLYDIIF